MWGRLWVSEGEGTSKYRMDGPGVGLGEFGHARVRVVLVLFDEAGVDHVGDIGDRNRRFSLLRVRPVSFRLWHGPE